MRATTRDGYPEGMCSVRGGKREWREATSTLNRVITMELRTSLTYAAPRSDAALQRFL